MIYYNSNKIEEWNFGDENIIKVYRDNAVCYYKVTTSGGTPEYKVCYAVVDDISQYHDTEFVDVFNKADEKWYKLNNLNQYEEYGVYGASTAETQSRLPSGYTEVEYIRQNSNYDAYINTGVILFDNTSNTYTITTRLSSEFHSNLGCATIISCERVNSPYDGLGYRYKCSSTVDELEFFGWHPNYSSSSVDNGDGTRTITFTSTGNSSFTTDVPLSYMAAFSSTTYGANASWRHSDSTIYSSTIIKNDVTVRDFVPAMRDNDSKYGLYDLITNEFYTSPNNVNFSGGPEVTPTAVTTYYEGKLAIVDGYEYMYSGSSWVNVGEASEGYTEYEYVQGNGTSYIATDYVANANTSVEIETSGYYQTAFFGSSHYDPDNGNMGSKRFKLIYQNSNGIRYDYALNQIIYSNSSVNSRGVIKMNRTGGYLNGTKVANFPNSLDMSDNHAIIGIFQDIWYNIKTGEQVPHDVIDSNFTKYPGKIYNVKLYEGDTLVRNFVPAIKDGVVGMYETVNDVMYGSENSTPFTVGGTATPHENIPIKYAEKADPLNDLTFETMADAQAYAYNNCVYDGMKATIAGDIYVFNSEDVNGWVEVPYYYKFEDVTPNAASGWTITKSATYNPDSTYYDDFSLENNTTNNVSKIAKITIFGYDHFTYYLRSYGYSTYAYLTSTNLDELQTAPTSVISYSSSSAITNTYNWNKNAGSAVNLSNYRRVTYNNLDKNVEHTFYVTYYGRTYSSYYSNATILIPKNQSNENWEQVTFSSSTNVSGSTKSLYIDGNNSTSGGTSYFYNRWMIGLPAGSHSSYTNYGSYDYCPSVTSATFTSVSGGTRKVDYSYTNTTNKTLQFRLVDESGNTITTSSTVYYNVIFINSCSMSSSSSNLTFPRSQSVKVGGGFYFTNSSNRHYIYGYQPNIQLNTNYYSDNYNTYFDIPYTKLSTEAVTIAYTTYDPSDVEVPIFQTNISWPYGNSGTSSTTLASYEVPYTYSYTVTQTSDKFSASTASYTYTAGQTSRTITFTSLYPNNREFATVADLEAYQYAWEGMKAYVDGTTYEYTNGEWSIKEGTIWYDPASSNAEFNIGHYWGEGYKMVFNTYLSGSFSSDSGSFWRYQQHTPIEFSLYSNGFYYDFHNPTSTSEPSVYTGDYSWRVSRTGVLKNYENSQILNIILTNGTVRVELEETGTAIVTASTTTSAQNWYNGLYQALISLANANKKCHLSRIQVYNANNELVNDLKFVKNAGVTGSQEISIYDSVLGVKYDNTNSNTPIYHIVY